MKEPTWVTKLKTKWNIATNKDFILIMIVFSLAGMAIGFQRQIVFHFFGIDHYPLWAKVLIYVPMIVPIYQINLLNFGPDQITKISCDYGDGNLRVFRDNIQANLTQPHVYLKAGRYTSQCTLTLDNGLLLPNSATVTIIGRDRCWDSSIYKCDMDRDAIPDICDEDIDGDEINTLS